MYNPEHAGFSEAKAHVDWAHTNLPNDNWAQWTVRSHRDNPEQFNTIHKPKIEAMASLAPKHESA